MSKISVKDLDLYYGDFKALKNINIEIDDEELKKLMEHEDESIT